MDTKHGYTITAQLVAGAILLVALAAGLGAYLQIRQLRASYDQQARKLRSLRNDLALDPAGAVDAANAVDRRRKALADEGRRAERKAWLLAGLLGTVAVLIGVGGAVLLGRRIARPIKELAGRAQQIAEGNLMSRVSVEAGDELGQLAENFNTMTDQLLILMHESAKQGAVQKELEVARSIQESLVPSGETTGLPGLELAALFEPASECGGDWWTYRELSDGRLLVIIGDVTGHGVPAALITAAAKSAVDTFLAMRADALEVPELLESLNYAITESAQGKLAMSCFASVVNPAALSITFANAGHNFPYRARPSALEGVELDGSSSTLEGVLHVMNARGNRLGDQEDSNYEARTEALEVGDLLVWYTDGVVEAENRDGEPYGEKRFRRLLLVHAWASPAEIRDAVRDALAQHVGDVPQGDDMTLVIGRVAANGSPEDTPS